LILVVLKTETFLVFLRDLVPVFVKAVSDLVSVGDEMHLLVLKDTHVAGLALIHTFGQIA